MGTESSAINRALPSAARFATDAARHAAPAQAAEFRERQEGNALASGEAASCREPS